MKRPRTLTLIAAMMLCSLLGAALPAAAQEGGPAAPQAVDAGGPDGADAIQAALGSAITYQGSLKKNGQPVNTACSFQFSLWDAVSGGVQAGATQAVDNVPVQAGVFTVRLNFDNQFTGDARWIQTSVRCAGDGSFTTLAPRQLLTAAPYAIGLRLGAVVRGARGGDLIYVEQNLSNSVAIHGKATQSSGTGVLGESFFWAGVWGQSTNASGVVGRSEGQFAGGVYGENTGQGYGVYGKAANNVAVFGESGSFDAVLGITTARDRVGVRGVAQNTGSVGVWGEAGGPGIFGTGVYGVGNTGVWGRANGLSSSVGVLGDSGGYTGTYAGYFQGRVAVIGNLSKGGGSFKIDHPLDPQGKYLSHSFVESPDMKNIYDGVVTLDARGEATVQLPDWFAALNGGAEHRSDYRYQLTTIGGYAPVYISREIDGNRFSIAGGTAGLKVSWQVTGIRHDPYAEQNRIVVEEDKPAAEQGKYLYPAAYGRPQSEGIAAQTAPQVSGSAMPEGVQP